MLFYCDETMVVATRAIMGARVERARVFTKQLSEAVSVLEGVAGCVALNL
jgi:hypothetical protein